MSNDNVSVSKLKKLMREFLEYRISVTQFVDEYIRDWKQMRDLGISSNRIIDNIMVAADAFDEDITVPTPYTATEEALRKEIGEALNQLTDDE
jgi:hypothetical protein